MPGSPSASTLTSSPSSTKRSGGTRCGERLWAQLMVALYRCGRQADALAAYQTARRQLDEHLGVPPGPGLDEVQRAVLQHHPSLDLPKAVQTRSTLPHPLGVFIGREQERRALAALLDDHRLVTVLGAAGIGKSRFAVEAARSMTKRFPSGIWLVDLAPLVTPELVPQAVADALGLRTEPGVPLTGTVAAALGSRKAMLILDNCEHLLPACSSLAAAAATAGTELRVLATSTENLGVPGEAIFPLSPLPVPGPADPWEQAAGSASVLLFAARAAGARPGFRLTEANIGAVREICRRLDGMPLAIELAASRAATVALDHIADRLDHQFRLLDARRGTPPGRHRGLDTAVQWSHDLLAESERLLFARLSVFSGGFTLDTAEAVVTDAHLPRHDVAAYLSVLVSRSLVQLEQTASALGRYRMLEPLRRYAQARLADRGETATMAERHARHYTDWIERAGAFIYRAGSTGWLDQIRAENENLRAALQWAFGADGDAPLGARIATVLWHPWDLAGARVEGLHWIDSGLRAVPASEPERRMPLLAAATLLRLGLGEIDTAGELAAEQLVLARTQSDRRWEGDALTRLGMVAWTRGEHSRAATYLKHAIDALQAAQDTWREAIALGHLARVQRDARLLPTAQSTAEAAVATARRVGEGTALGFCLDVLASVVLQRGRPAQAAELVEDALAHYRAIGYREGEASALHTIGRILLERSDIDAARRAFCEASQLCRKLGHRAGLASGLVELADTALATGDDLHAAVLLGAALAQRDLLEVPASIAERHAQETLRSRLLPRLGADGFQRASRQGADADLEQLIKP